MTKLRIEPHEYNPGLYNACNHCGQSKASPVHGSAEEVRLRQENVELADQIADRQRQLDDLGRQHAEALQRNLQLTEQLDAGSDVDSLRRDELDAVIAERDELRAEVGRLRQATRTPPEPEHKHEYEWVRPDEPTQRCSCGKVNPRLAVEESDEEIEPDLTPWDELIEQVRYELACWPDWGSEA